MVHQLTESLTTNGLVTLTLGDGLMLVSFWKPLILLVTFGVWAWVVSTIYDKHAERFFLPRENWNLVHMLVGTIGLGTAVLFPMKGEAGFWIGWGVMVVLMIGDLLAYAIAANKDDRVPEAFKIRADILTKMAVKRAAKKEEKQQAKAKLTVRGPDKQPVAVPQMETPEYAVRTTAEEIYLKAEMARASQFEIGPTGQGTQFGVTMLVDGVPMKGDVMEGQLAVKVMDFWKGAAKLDLADRRKKLQGVVNIEQATSKRPVRVTSQGVTGGMKLTILFDPEESVRRKADDLGLLDNQLSELRELVKEAKGLVLLASPPDAGRTTLFYSVVGMHDAYTLTVQTVEMDPQMQLEGARHQAFDPNIEGADYATLARSMLRRDPNVLGVGEMPDAATAKVVAAADFARVRVYLSVRADGAMTAIEGWSRAVGDPALAAKNLRGAIGGKLIRKLCVNCRVPYPASPDMLKKLGAADAAGKVQQLFKKGGQVLIKNKPEICPVCSGIGYVGQEGVFEVYTLGDEERDLLAQNNLAGVRAAFKKRGLPSIQQAAIRKALSGITSVEEVMRITGGGTSTPPPPPAPAPVPAGRA